MMIPAEESEPMFTDFTEKARRVIFFARYEASRWGSVPVQPEHLLLGLLRADPELLHHLAPTQASIVEGLRTAIQGGAPSEADVSPTVVMPLSPDAEEVINEAFKEKARLGHGHVDTEHLLLALLAESEDKGMKLRGRGAAEVRAALNRHELHYGPVADRISDGSITPQTGQGDGSAILTRSRG